jgi:NAD(P)H-flavin reductase
MTPHHTSAETKTCHGSVELKDNPYIPHLARITKISTEVESIERAVKTFRVEFLDEKIKKEWTQKPGQCAMVNVFGYGESFISICSPPTRKGSLEFSILRVGKVTTAIHQLEEGAVIGVRGPYGNGFPLEDWKSKNLIFIGGGIGQAPLRSVYLSALDRRNEFGKVILISGARTSKDLVFGNELLELMKQDDVDVHLSIDAPEPDWKYFVGFVPDNVKKVAPSPENSIAVTCGPPIMIKFAMQNLSQLGFSDDQIYTTLENRMKCGIGKCGRCNIGSVFVCQDGPVFNKKQINQMVADF